MSRIALFILLAFLAATVSCATKDGEIVAHSPLDMAKVKEEEGETSCGALIDEFQAALSAANHCRTADDCDAFDTGVTGCWLQFHKSEREALAEAQKKVSVPRCRVFLPMYKCMSHPPGEAVCNGGRCAWHK